MYLLSGIIFSILLFICSSNVIFASDNVNEITPWKETYYIGKKEGKITDDYSTFIKKCKNDLMPKYMNLYQENPTLTFAEYAAANNYDQDLPTESNTQNVNVNDISDTSTVQNPLFPSLYKASRATIKAGDMLICHGTNSSGRFLGHEAIATSSKYVLEMRGPEGAKNNNYHTPLTRFYKDHLNGRGDYIVVYRIKKHPIYARDAAQYAWDHMYKNNHINYLTTTNLYHKDPSYCSKYAYLAYWWGTSHKGMKGSLMWVFPFTMINVFQGSYYPSAVYKLTSR